MGVQFNRSWTPDQEAEVARRWTAGESAGQIASSMGMTRSQVCGKVNRLKLTTRDKPFSWAVREDRKPKSEPKPVQAKKPKDRRTSPINTIKLREARKVEATVVDASPIRTKAWERLPGAPPPISIEQLTPLTCRWPLGDTLDSSFGYCGVRCDEGKRYCTSHHQMAHTAPFVPVQRPRA